MPSVPEPYSSDGRWLNVKHWLLDNCHGTTAVLAEKPIPMPLCPPQIPRRIRVTALRSERPIASAWVQPSISLAPHYEYHFIPVSFFAVFQLELFERVSSIYMLASALRLKCCYSCKDAALQWCRRVRSFSSDWRDWGRPQNKLSRRRLRPEYQCRQLTTPPHKSLNEQKISFICATKNRQVHQPRYITLSIRPSITTLCTSSGANTFLAILVYKYV